MSANKQEVKKVLKKAANVGLGLSQIVGGHLSSAISNLEKDGYIDRAEGKKLAKDLLSEANKLQKTFSSRVDKQVQRVVKSSGTKSLASKTKKKPAKKKRK